MDIKTIQTFVEELDKVTSEAIDKCGKEINPEMKLILGHSIGVWSGIAEALEKTANRLIADQEEQADKCREIKKKMGLGRAK